MMHLLSGSEPETMHIIYMHYLNIIISNVVATARPVT